MALFQLSTTDPSSPTAELVGASSASLAQEANLEVWLENSPWAIAQEPLLIIGRQTCAHPGSDILFPDLLALDKDGNLVIVELKKGRTPREVVAQLLEYAAWGHELSSEEVFELATQYLSTESCAVDLRALFLETFEQDEFPSLNRHIRLFIAAEEISPSVARSCRFLRTCYGVDVSCVEFRMYQTETGNVLISSDYVVGREDVPQPKHGQQRWLGELPVKEVVWQAAQRVAAKKEPFAPKEVVAEVLASYPNFNKSTVGCQIISDCVNHTSRHHYPGGNDRYWWVEKGKYQLYDPQKHGSLPGNTT